MFGRELRTKLPTLCPNKSFLDERTRDCNWSKKLTGKLHADRQRHAVDNPVALGDAVLVKNTKLTGKLATNFEHKCHIVQTKEGQEVNLKFPDGMVKWSNSSFDKPYRTQEESSKAAETPADAVVYLVLQIQQLQRGQEAAISRYTDVRFKRLCSR